MKLVFWQNSISIHQIAFLNSLDENANIKVILVYDKEILSDRIEEGWNIPDNIKVQVIPYNEVNKEIDYDLANSLHVISGFAIDRISKKALDYCRYNKQKYVILSESFRVNGVKGYLRYLKYLYKVNLYKPEIIFAYGKIGVKQFNSLSLFKKRIYPFAYTIEASKCLNNYNSDDEAKFRIAYVGKLDERKAVSLLLRSLKDLEIDVQVDIIGDGPCYNELKEYTIINSMNTYVYFRGVQSNDNVLKYMSQADLMVLPSKHDGWGAVVNESLSVGTRVLVSDQCGSSCLFDIGCFSGKVFELNNKMLANSILEFYSYGKLSGGDRNKIIEFYNNTVHADVISKYFLKIINSGNNEKINAPWLKSH